MHFSSHNTSSVRTEVVLLRSGRKIVIMAVMTGITFALVKSKQEVKFVPMLNESSLHEGSKTHVNDQLHASAAAIEQQARRATQPVWTL
jgi:Cu/Ag efflux pump CusA